MLEGEGSSELGGESFDWRENDIFVVPALAWRRHRNSGGKDAIIYRTSDRPLLERIGQYRAQGRRADGGVAELAL